MVYQTYPCLYPRFKQAHNNWWLHSTGTTKMSGPIFRVGNIGEQIPSWKKILLDFFVKVGDSRLVRNYHKPPFSNTFPIVFYGYSRVFYGFPMVFLGFPMVFLWFPMQTGRRGAWGTLGPGQISFGVGSTPELWSKNFGIKARFRTGDWNHRHPMSDAPCMEYLATFVVHFFGVNVSKYWHSVCESIIANWNMAIVFCGFSHTMWFSIAMEYLPTWLVHFFGVNVGIHIPWSIWECESII